MKKTSKRVAALTAAPWVLAAWMLSGCGGGGGGDASSTPVAQAAPSVLTLSGTAATGAAMALAAVEIKCVSATGKSTTTAEGTYSIAMPGASLPCVLSATSADGKTVLRSVAETGSATSATVNITPLSEIIVTRLAGGDAAALFTTFDATAQAKLTPGSLSDARGVVMAALKGTVDLTGVDPIKDPLVAASAGKVGNELDKKLDALGAALKASGTSFADLNSVLAANPNATTVVQGMLQPVAESCTALRSGNYVGLDPYAATPVLKLKIDAAKLTITDAANQVTAVAPSPGNACAFATASGSMQGFVARSGVIVVRYAVSATVSRLMLMLPEQTVPLAELAGTWNLLAYTAPTVTSLPVASYNVQTLNTSGQTTAGATCVGLQTCQAWTIRPTDVFAVSGEGGYVLTDDQGSIRAFPVKTSSGQMAVFGIFLDTKRLPLGVLVMSKQDPLALPVVDQVDRFWDLETTPAGTRVATEAQLKITAVNTTDQSFTRLRASDGRVDVFQVNKPRPGMRYRAAGSSPGNNGQFVSFSEMLAMPLNGMGMTAYATSPVGQVGVFGVSVARP